MRYDEKGKIIEDFILNIKPFDESNILIAGKTLAVSIPRTRTMGII